MFAILLLAAAGLFAACTDPADSPGVPDATTTPLPTETPTAAP
jgi:type IV pilus biogenesis protein CpaD/CtpE